MARSTSRRTFWPREEYERLDLFDDKYLASLAHPVFLGGAIRVNEPGGNLATFSEHSDGDASG
jgi:hypothetical protein